MLLNSPRSQETSSNDLFKFSPKFIQDTRSNFLLNPVSEYEERKKKYDSEISEYVGNEMQQRVMRHTKHSSVPFIAYTNDHHFEHVFGFVPKVNALENTRGSPIQQTGIQRMQSDKLPQYRNQLQTFNSSPQISLQGKYQAKQQEQTPDQDYFPFGKPGAGAPYRDQNGNTIGRRNQGFTSYRLGEAKVDLSQNHPQANLSKQDYHDIQKRNFKQQLLQQIDEANHKKQLLRDQEKLRDIEDEQRIKRELKQMHTQYVKEIGIKEDRSRISTPDYEIGQEYVEVKKDFVTEFYPERRLLANKIDTTAYQDQLRSTIQGLKNTLSNADSNNRNLLNNINMLRSTRTPSLETFTSRLYQSPYSHSPSLKSTTLASVGQNLLHPRLPNPLDALRTMNYDYFKTTQEYNTRRSPMASESTFLNSQNIIYYLITYVFISVIIVCI